MHAYNLYNRYSGKPFLVGRGFSERSGGVEKRKAKQKRESARTRHKQRNDGVPWRGNMNKNQTERFKTQILLQKEH